MSTFDFSVESGNTLQLKTAGKYCDRDIVVTATGGGGVTPVGTKEITENGTYDVTEYASAEVDVQPKLENMVTESNGTFYPSDGYDGFGIVKVDVPTTTVEPLTATQNGTYRGFNVAYNPVTVNVQPKTEELTITENGEYVPSTGVDGFSKVVVALPAAEEASF